MAAKLPDLEFKIQNAYRPGPGVYNPDHARVKNTSPQYKIGTGARSSLGDAKEGKFRPGPGAYAQAYDPLVARAPKYGFGSGTRNELGRLSVPGPGAYKAKDFTGKEGKGKTMSGLCLWAPHEKEQSFKPGPGTYTDSKI